jgi:hypothetical protein
MCRQGSIDLLGVNISPECNECRELNRANIQACQEGRSGGPAVATTKTYRLVCKVDSSGNCVGWRRCLEPHEIKDADETVVGTYASWETCYHQSSMWSREQ